ncbi:MAG: HD-GYP domain-containing protein [Clostridiales bacterium]|nr:HD-GYP domain-containing protein [Clostridiales bacterium]
MRFMPLSFLSGGETLAVSIFNSNMQVLMTAGATLSEKNINRIKQFGIQSVYIQDDVLLKDDIDPDAEPIMDIIDPKIRQASVYNVKKCIETFDLKVKQQKRKLKYGDYGMYLAKDLTGISKSLIQEIMNSKNTNISMMNIKNAQDYYYEHSVNVAVLSAIIGLEIGLKITELENLTYGSLLADIGNHWLSTELLSSPNLFNEAEFNEIKKHPFLGYDYINDNTIINAHIKNLILQHHERLDGSGYPKHLTSDDINPLTKILMISDVYDAMTSDRSYREAHSQIEAIEYLMANASTLFDFELINVFVRKIIPYPVGTYVLLSNGQRGVVLNNAVDYPLRPKVRIFGDSRNSEQHKFVIDLLETKNITIDRIIYSLSA